MDMVLLVKDQDGQVAQVVGPVDETQVKVLSAKYAGWGWTCGLTPLLSPAAALVEEVI